MYPIFISIKYKSVTVYIKNKKRVGAYIIISLRTLHLNVFPKNKQNKLRFVKKDKVKEESHLNYPTVIKYAFSFLVCLFFII